MCFDFSNNSILYKYEYQGLYYENCMNGNLTNNSPIKYCKCTNNNEKCLYCSNKPLINNNLCIKCNHDYYEIENYNNTIEYKECYKDPIGYYLDINESLYKKCFYSCKTCEIPGNNRTHNCLECSNDYPLVFKNNDNYPDCFQNCSYNYYFEEYNNFHCTINNICPKKFPILIGRECKKDIRIINMNENLIDCLNNKITKEIEIYCYDKIIKGIEDIYTSTYFDTSKFCNGQDEIIEIDKIKVILTTTENQKNNLNNDNITIDLRDCEQSLKQAYNLPDDEILYIKMLEISQEEMRIPKVEYDIYAKLNGINLTKLSLESCENNLIFLLIPVTIDNVDKLNIKSGYYNDLCYTATSNNGTDIIIKDRQNEYPSLAVCQDGCDFFDYNYNLKKAICSCHAEESSSSFADMKIDKKKLLDNFKNIKNIANLNILKCFEVKK